MNEKIQNSIIDTMCKLHEQERKEKKSQNELKNIYLVIYDGNFGNNEIEKAFKTKKEAIEYIEDNYKYECPDSLNIKLVKYKLVDTEDVV